MESICHSEEPLFCRQRIERASLAEEPAVKHHDDTFMRMASGLLAQICLGERRQLYAMLGHVCPSLP
jgi:hypothetical protein